MFVVGHSLLYKSALNLSSISSGTLALGKVSFDLLSLGEYSLYTTLYYTLINLSLALNRAFALHPFGKTQSNAPGP